MNCVQKPLVEDRGLCRSRHRGVSRTSAVPRVRGCDRGLCVAQSKLGAVDSDLKRLSYVKHAITVGTADGLRATSVLP